jgi:hypothetical protein
VSYPTSCSDLRQAMVRVASMGSATDPQYGGNTARVTSLPRQTNRTQRSWVTHRGARGASFMDTIVHRTVRFFSQTIRVQRTNAAVSRSKGHGGVLSPAPTVSHTGREPLAALLRPEATPERMVGATRTTRADCSVVNNLPLFLWHDAAPTPENPGVARSRRGIVPHLPWEQHGLLLGSVGSDIRRV